MLQLFGINQVIMNCFRVASVACDRNSLDSVQSIRDGFFRVLERKQPHVPVNWTNDVFVHDHATIQKISHSFTEGVLDDSEQSNIFGPCYKSSVQSAKYREIEEAYRLLLSLDESMSVAFRLAIHSIFIRKNRANGKIAGAHAGSTSGALGVIWLSAGDGLSAVDIMELLIHELTHNLVFVDELNFPHFNYKLVAQQENFAKSAILKRSRPMDKVVHSIFVGAEILLARKRFLSDKGPARVHPATTQLENQLLDSMTSVFSLPNLSDVISEHLRDLLLQVHALCFPRASLPSHKAA